MDPRVRALSACLHAALALLATASGAGAGEARNTSALAATLDLHDAAVEERFDATTLAALDALLLDPVDLNRGALSRLLSVPWLTPAHLDAIVNGRPLGSTADLARLPGWDAELARSVAAFVSLAPVRRPWQAQVRTLVASSRQDVQLRAESTRWSLGARVDMPAAATAAAWASLQARGVRFVAGDLRLSHAQGLLWWSGETSLRAARAPFRRARGAFGVESRVRTRTLRGGAMQLDGRGVSISLAAGEDDVGEAVRGLAARWPLWRGHELQLGGVEVKRRRFTSFGWEAGLGGTRLALEIAPLQKRPGMALAAAHRGRAGRLETRLQATPAGGSPLGAASATERTRATRHAVLHAVLQRGAVAADVALSHTTERDSLGEERESWEQRVAVRWRVERRAVEVRWRQRRLHSRALAVEGWEEPTLERHRGLVLRFLYALDASTSLGLDYRAEECSDALRTLTGSAWQMHLLRGRGGLTMQLALTSFAAASGNAAPVVAEPSVGGSPAARRLVGDGLRAAFGLRWRGPRLEAGARFSQPFVRGEATPEFELTLRLRVP